MDETMMTATTPSTENASEAAVTSPTTGTDTGIDTTTQDTGTQQTGSPEAGGTPDPEPKHKIRYNGQDMELTTDELRTLAQKGMNYDKVNQRLQEFQQNPELAAMRQAAAAQGIDVRELIRRTQEAGMREDVDKLLNKGYDEKAARDIVEGRRAKAQLELERRRAAEADARRQDFAEFRDMFGDVPPEDIPAEVWDEVRKGKSLTDSYLRHMHRKAKTEAAAAAKNEETRKAASPSPKSSTAPEKDYYDLDEMKNMTSEEVRKNYDKIIKSLKRGK